MAQINAIDRALENWGDWARESIGTGYGGPVLGSLIKRRARELGDGDHDIARLRRTSAREDWALVIDREVAVLPSILRRTVKFRYLVELPGEFASVRLSVSLATYKRYIERAQERIAENLRENGPRGIYIYLVNHFEP